MRDVYIIGTAQSPVQKHCETSLREMGASVVRRALNDARVETADALFLSNMLSDELQGQKHVAALIADTAGLRGIEAMQIRAATASGAAAFRTAYLAVASGQAELAIAAGVEKMSSGGATHAMTKALDAEQEVPAGSTLIGMNAILMRQYLERYGAPYSAFARFAVNAHRNAALNPNALLRWEISPEKAESSKIVNPPMRLFDCAPICDGAAAVILASAVHAKNSPAPVKVLASAAATDRFRVTDRADPLVLEASRLSADRALAQAGVSRGDIDFFEAHDAFSIMACLALEACGFAEYGRGWELARDDEISRTGRVPISTFGGLKARGHPVGASALYQICEITLQLTGAAGPNAVPGAKTALMQSIGGAGTTILTHVFGA